ncbi:Trafficking protein particle complex subunit 1 [Blastocladiella emersonii ATCC 22665]|nr:Trafficking protein particle complex subunit 1 [Blastocladiella emersonii ATCC 22665]
MIYSLHIFDRHCDCIYHGDYAQATAVAGALDASEQNKLVYGVIYSARNLVNKLRREPASDAPFLAFSTSHYKLHYYETPTSLKLVMITGTGVDTQAVRDVLRAIYRDIYVEHVAKNPLAATTPGPSLVRTKKKPVDNSVPPHALITNVAFRSALDQLVAGLMAGSD